MIDDQRFIEITDKMEEMDNQINHQKSQIK